jgi:hypothetical protein
MVILPEVLLAAGNSGNSKFPLLSRLLKGLLPLEDQITQTPADE